ncbi:MAG: hypothetical protein ABIF77_18540 [bacterium]|nr:hypothetical protein [bacterium]
MSEKHTIGGRTFLPLRESTVEQDFRFLSLIKRARIDEVVMEPGESPEAFARRLLEVTIESGVILDLLGCLLVPEDLAPRDRDSGEAWTRQMGEETAHFLGQLRDPRDKAEVRSLVLSLLVSFFESGIVSLWTSTTSSTEAIPNPENNQVPPAGTAPGPNSSESSPRATTTKPSGSSAGRSESPSHPTAG